MRCLLKILDRELLEAKQVGTLYHFTRYPLAKQIVEDNALKCTNSSVSYQFISLTRNKNFNYHWRPGIKTEVAFVLDGNKLSNKYKIEPYRDLMFIRDGDAKKGSYDEAEEIIRVKEIPGIRDYIIKVLVYKKTLDKYYEEDVVKFFKDNKFNIEVVN